MLWGCVAAGGTRQEVLCEWKEEWIPQNIKKCSKVSPDIDVEKRNRGIPAIENRDY